jgi:hypothetical protein
MLRRYREFRTAAEFVAQELSELPHVQRVVLFGSVAQPLRKEIPRFRSPGRSGAEVWHDCQDVDLAVWLSSLEDLKSLQRARARALARLFDWHNIGVAHHQVEMFIMEPATNRYLGRLCAFGQCPKHRIECYVPGCGQPAFLQQHSGYDLSSDSLAAKRCAVLFDREAGDADDDPDRD